MGGNLCTWMLNSLRRLCFGEGMHLLPIVNDVRVLILFFWGTHLSQGCVTRAEVRIDDNTDTVCKKLSGLPSRVLCL